MLQTTLFGHRRRALQRRSGGHAETRLALTLHGSPESSALISAAGSRGAI